MQGFHTRLKNCAGCVTGLWVSVSRPLLSGCFIRMFRSIRSSTTSSERPSRFGSLDQQTCPPQSKGRDTNSCSGLAGVTNNYLNTSKPLWTALSPLRKSRDHHRPFLIFRHFLLNGALCYRPLSRLSFTFEACQINSGHRAVLKKSLAEASEVPHADPQTEGFGFSLANAVGQITGQQFANLAEADAEVGQSMNQLKFRHMAVETIYGYWLPSAYADEVKKKLDAIEQKSVAAMKKFASKLQGARSEALEQELNKHVQGLKKFFAAHSVKIEPKPDYKGRFAEFVKARKSWLADERRLERIVRRLHVEQMPDIWGDEDAAQKFETSFFEDLAMRFDAPRKSWIVGVLREELNLTEGTGPEQLRSALEDRLKEGISVTRYGGMNRTRTRLRRKWRGRAEVATPRRAIPLAPDHAVLCVAEVLGNPANPRGPNNINNLANY